MSVAMSPVTPQTPEDRTLPSPSPTNFVSAESPSAAAAHAASPVAFTATPPASASSVKSSNPGKVVLDLFMTATQQPAAKLVWETFLAQQRAAINKSNG